MKVVVTGGAGFVGANLCRTLASDPAVDEVVALDDLSSGFASNLDGVDATTVIGDMGDPAVLDSVLPGAAAVVHLGARPSVPRSIEDPLASHHANATGTLQVLEGARRHGVGYVVVASSSSVYGSNPVLPKHEGLVPMPVSPYAVSKLATESYALAHASSFGLRTLALRFFNVFGPLQAAGHAYAAVVPAFVAAALAGEPVTIHGDGGQTRDFTFVGTVCEVLARAVASSTTSDRPVNLAFGTRSSLLEVLTRLEGILGHPIERHHAPPRAGDVRDSQADQTNLRALFPAISPVDLDDGLRRTVDWFRTGTVA
ncbi:MAG: NAD-dependent epimerase/dehydratase family protein [Acidimicrobiales bacterium]